jgi:ribonucleoside-diphosphate reductase alpha chain
MLAALDIEYGSPVSMEMIKRVMELKMAAELDATTDLAILRGAFPAWNKDREYINEGEELKPMNLQGTNAFYVNLCAESPDDALRMYIHGRRNVSWSTVAPTGTVSMMTQTTSGIEPLFSQYYTRRVKMMDKQETPDYVDPNDGEWYKEHLAVHPKIYQWYEKLGYDIPFDEHPIHKQKEIMEVSPWAESTSDKISPETRVIIQAIIQKYTTHSISSTVNLSENATIHDIDVIYKQAWANSLKGITVYRDKSRAGVMVNKDDFMIHNAPKRGRELESNFHQLRVKGEKFGVVIGLKNGKPFEVFAFRDDDKKTKFMKGVTVKQRKGSYVFTSADGQYTYDCLQCLDNVEEKATTLYGSMLLRHGAPIPYIVKTMKKVNDNIVSFSTAITRVLTRYIPDGVKSAENCPKCESKLTFENGCAVCKECGYDAC